MGLEITRVEIKMKRKVIDNILLFAEIVYILIYAHYFIPPFPEETLLFFGQYIFLNILVVFGLLFVFFWLSWLIWRGVGESLWRKKMKINKKRIVRQLFMATLFGMCFIYGVMSSKTLPFYLQVVAMIVTSLILGFSLDSIITLLYKEK